MRATAKAAAIYAEAFGRDPAFAQFYRSLDAYSAASPSKSDVLVVDPELRFLQGHARQQPRSTSRLTAMADLLWPALALVLILEGLLPFISPGLWRRVFARCCRCRMGRSVFWPVLCVCRAWLLWWAVT